MKVPLGARVLLWLSLLTWLVVRVPLMEGFSARLASDPPHAVAADLPHYMALADALLRHHVVGYYDVHRLVPLQALADGAFDMRARPDDRPPAWKLFDYNDWGFGLVVAVAWLLPLGKAGVWAIILLQYVADALCLLAACFIATRLLSPWAGGAAALVYAAHPALASVVNMPFYYFWNVAVAMGALTLWVWLYTSETRRPWAWALAVGLLIGVSTLIRSTNELLLAAFLLFLLVRERLTRRAALLAACMVSGFVLPLLPVAAIKFHEHGRVQLAGKEIFWHTVLCGIGCHPNPWGLEWDDSVAFARIKRKYGIVYDTDNARPYDQACKQEVLALWHENPWIFGRNFAWNVAIGLKPRGGVPPDQDIPSVHRTLNVLRTLNWLGVFALLAMGRRMAYWSMVLLALFLYPIVSIAPLTSPNFAYSSGIFGLEAVIAGIGIGWLCGLVRRR